MSITYPYTILPLGAGLVQVTVVSSLTNPTIYWYLDGVYHSRTETLTQTFSLEDGDQAQIDAVDTTDPDNFDVEANQPTAYPARKTLWWTRSTDSDLAYFTVKQQKAAGGYSTIATVPVSEAWSYRCLTPRLDDLALYDWKVYPVDAAGNEGTELSLEQETVVRKPDAPDVTLSFDGGTTYVTFTAAA